MAYAGRFFRLFMVGDVMLGRGVDQILPHSCDPILYEGYMKDARGYVDLAVSVNGELPKNRSFDYVWGEALQVLSKMKPDFSLINLETAVTLSSKPWPHKGINYRMHPKNIQTLSSANISCCMLANNHVLDWDYPGLIETIDTIKAAGILTTGAGKTLEEAKTPASVRIMDRNLRVYGVGHESSGVYRIWSATAEKPGVFYVDIYSSAETARFIELINSTHKPDDYVVVSIHWGGNWGYEIDRSHIDFAHRLIDSGVVDLVHGHSSHHVKGLEIYKKKLILYGCGDFLSDYEGISGHKEYRDDLSFMYFVDVSPDSKDVVDITLVPTQIKQIRINTPSTKDTQWLLTMINRECARFGVKFIQKDSVFKLDSSYI